MRKLRVLVLLHPDLMPPEKLDGTTARERQPWLSLYDVTTTLRELGHEVKVLGVQWELAPIRHEVKSWKPHVVFNLLEEFYGMVEFDQHVVAYLELLKVPYTGCNPRGLVLARGKALSKKLVGYHRVKVPGFFTVRRGRAPKVPKGCSFPLIVKSLTADASEGIAQASIVEDKEALVERLHFVHEKIGTDAIAEEFIPGREIYCTVLGNSRLQVFPPWEVSFERLPAGTVPIATAKAKHDPEYQQKIGMVQHPAEGLDEKLVDALVRTSKRIYRALEIDGYARIDYRLAPDGTFYFLEANPNPDIGSNEEAACSAEAAGISYPQLVQKILALGRSRGSHG
ncbi:MAG: D-alanine--D-alanine ligase [Planctomycetota bacterium JB042]